MAKTALERKRAQLERKAEALRNAPELTRSITTVPFFEYIEKEDPPEWTDFELGLIHAGIDPIAFDDDSGPQSADGHYQTGEGDYEGKTDSIGRAEAVVGGLLQAAQAMAELVNSYKRAQIDLAIAKLEQSDLTDTARKRSALNEIVRLTKMRDQLDKRFRRDFPAIEVKEI